MRFLRVFFLAILCHVIFCMASFSLIFQFGDNSQWTGTAFATSSKSKNSQQTKNPQQNDTLPFPAGKCIGKARKLIAKGKLNEAIRLMQSFQKEGKGASESEGLKNGYSHYYIDYMLGNTYMMLAEKKASGSGKTEEKNAVRYYQNAVRKKSDLAPAWLNLASCRYNLGESAPAAKAFVKGYEFSSVKERKAEQLYYAAICYFQAGGTKNRKKAYKTFQRLIKAHPNKISLEWTESYVNILLAIDYKKTALPHIETLAKKCRGKKQMQWQEILLYHYLNMNMDKKALAFSKKLTQSYPTEPKWWKAHAHIHLDRNELVQGLDALIVYSFLTPLKRDEAKLIADLYLSIGIPSEAAQRYETMLKGKFDAEMAGRLVHAYQASAQADRAVDWIDRVIAAKDTVSKKRDGLLAQKKRLQLQLAHEGKYRKKAE